MKNLLTKVVILHKEEELKTLAAEYRLPYYTQGRDAGRFHLYALALIKIDGFEKLFLQKNYQEAKVLLLAAVGKLSKFKEVFSNNPYEDSRVPYWHGSYVYALMDTFPELELTFFDFPNYPKDLIKIFNNDEKRALAVLIEHARLSQSKKAKAFLVNPRIESHKSKDRSEYLEENQENTYERFQKTSLSKELIHWRELVEDAVEQKNLSQLLFLLNQEIHSQARFIEIFGAVLLQRSFYNSTILPPEKKLSWQKALELFAGYLINI